MWISSAIVVLFIGVVWLEYRRPLRAMVESRSAHLARNLVVAGLSAATVALCERPLVMPLSALVEARQWGLLGMVHLPATIELIIAVVLMDYSLYLWHMLNHRVAFLWRFHLVHHVDRDLDASTALRFHFGEIALSVPWRALQVAIIGVGPGALSSWQALLLVSILFHHSNVRLPIAWERQLVRLIVTPRMHGIHHSAVQAETDSNWSSGLSVWDRLHGTLQLNVPQGQVEIGVPAYRAADDVSLPSILIAPFRHQRPSWQTPDGEAPTRMREPAGWLAP